MPSMSKAKLVLRVTATATAMATVFLTSSAWAKLPAPVLDDAAKAKAAEAAAKTAWNGKVDGFQLCRSMEKTASHYVKTATGAGKAPKPATATPPCADPGAFVYPPPAQAAAPVAAPAAASALAAAKKS